MPEDYIKEFISKMKAAFPYLNFNYKFHKDLDVWSISYDNKIYKYNNVFICASGKLIKLYFYDNNFYDFWFDYESPNENTQQ